MGDNKPYSDVTFASDRKRDVVGTKFDPNLPINNSPNNTGKKRLPPAQKAFIWYPYDRSEEFPLVGKGGRNAMAGPVFYADMFTNASSRFPDYYEGKLFIYDFMRDWMLAVSMDEAGNYQEMEYFLPNFKLSSPMDMEFGPDGALYIVEYGTRWFAKNADARLIRIDYSEGNRAPIAVAEADKLIGGLPMTVNFSATKSKDFDSGDQLNYEWQFTSDPKDRKTGEFATFTYDKPGVYSPELTVSDQEGNSGRSKIKNPSGQ